MAYVLANPGSGRPVVLTTDVRAFGRSEGDLVEVVEIGDQSVPSSGLTIEASRIRRRVAEWSRNGSSLGLRVERLHRQLQWRLRHIRRLPIAYRQWLAARESRSGRDLRNPNLLSKLEVLHSETPIDQIAVFDLFDLPTVLRFSSSRDVEVVVR